MGWGGFIDPKISARRHTNMPPAEFYCGALSSPIGSWRRALERGHVSGSWFRVRDVFFYDGVRGEAIVAMFVHAACASGMKLCAGEVGGVAVVESCLLVVFVGLHGCDPEGCALVMENWRDGWGETQAERNKGPRASVWRGRTGICGGCGGGAGHFWFRVD